MEKIASWKTIGLLLVTLLVVIAVPLTTRQVSNRQETRTKAVSGPGVADLALSPASLTSYYTSITTNSTFDVNVTLDTGTTPIYAVDVALQFDPTTLQVVPDPAVAGGNGITPGTILAQILYNKIDNALGRITFSAGSSPIGSTYTGTGVIASIKFRALKAVAATNVTFLPTTLVSDVNSSNILGTTTNGSYTITLDTTGPVAPTPQSPADAGYQVSGNVNLTWSASTDTQSGFDHYELQYANNSAFTSPTTVNNITATSASISLSADSPYYWQVRAYDKLGNVSNWSSAWNFILDTTPPGVPALSAPANGYLQTSRTVPLSWTIPTDANGIASYKIQVANNSNFTGATEYTVTTNSYSVTVATDGQYFWHVQAVDLAGNNGTYSVNRNFTIDGTVPTLPGLLTPTNASNLNTLTPTFTWNASSDTGSGVDHYDLQTSLTSTFATPTNNQIVGTATSFTLPSGVITADNVYYWRLQAADVAGNVSGWTVYRSMTVDTTAPGVPTLNPVAITAGSRTVSFSWSVVTDSGSGLANYEIQVDADSSITPPYTYSATPTSTTASTTLSADGTYYWHVRAIDKAGNIGAWSTAQPFGIDITPPTAISNLSAGSPTTTSVVLTWTAPNANPGNGTAYDIRYSTSSITGTNFSSATAVANPPTPAAAGSAESLTVSNLTPGTTYYFALKTQDANSNWSIISNVVSLATSQPIPTLSFSVTVQEAITIPTTPRGTMAANLTLLNPTTGAVVGSPFSITMSQNRTSGLYETTSPVVLTGITPGSYRVMLDGVGHLKKELTKVNGVSTPVNLVGGSNTPDWKAQQLFGGDAIKDTANTVNALDFGKLAGDFLNSATQGTSTADFNFDGRVDALDFGALAGNFLKAGD